MVKKNEHKVTSKHKNCGVKVSWAKFTFALEQFIVIQQIMKA